ncbi:MAG: sigma 54-interacting transcriptional regulator, partial [Proteobacteria bacterium]|nr:sigma 54-interacting transcriptional regulator [Pseudomonadota bacterium]
MHTMAENIWAGGDCAESFHLISKRPVNIALGTVANKHGRVVGINAGGGHAVFSGLVGTAVSKIGKVEIARTGLQEKEIQRVGGTKSLGVDVRVISATHRNLEQMVEKGKFREDLWYRLNVFPIIIPPLRQRPEDIPAL